MEDNAVQSGSQNKNTVQYTGARRPLASRDTTSDHSMGLEGGDDDHD
jgi:hypothetical protein